MHSILLLMFIAFVKNFAALIIIRPFRTYLKTSGVLILATTLSAFSTISVADFTSKPLDFNATMPQLFLLLFIASLSGLLIAIPWAFAVETFAMSGRLVDAVRGAQIAEQISPESGNRVSVLEQFCLILGVFVLLETGAHLHFLESLLQIPVWGSSVNNELNEFVKSGISERDLFSILQGAVDSISVAFSFAASSLVAVFLIDLAAAMLSRNLKNLNVAFELLPLKLVVGLLAFYFCISIGPTDFGDIIKRVFYSGVDSQLPVWVR